MSRVVLFVMFLTISVSVFSKTKINMNMGDVKYSSSGGSKWIVLDDNQRIRINDIVKTGNDGTLELDIDGNIITVNPNSRFKISSDRDNKESGKSISLYFGRLGFNVKKIFKKDSGFKVNTAAGVCAVRGTNYSVSAGNDGKMLVQVNSGAVALRGKSREVLIKKNQESSVVYGGDPSKIKILKKQDWNKWLEKSKKNIKGNEYKLLKISLKKIQKLNREILAIEKLVKESRKFQILLKKKSDEFKKKGDKKNHIEYWKMSYKKGRTADTSKVKAKYKAGKIDLVYSFANSVYENNKKGRKSRRLYKKINKIYERHYDKYIYEIYEIRKKRKK